MYKYFENLSVITVIRMVSSCKLLYNKVRFHCQTTAATKTIRNYAAKSL